jgi:hypothetical protein
MNPEQRVQSLVAEAVDTCHKTQIELKIFWQTTLLAVHFLSRSDRFLITRSPDGSATHTLDDADRELRQLVLDAPELTDHSQAWTLVGPSAEGPALFVPARAGYHVEKLESATALRTPSQDPSLDTTTALPIEQTSRVGCTLGGLRFECRLVYAAKTLAKQRRRDRAMLLTSLFSALLVLSALTASWRISSTRSTLLFGDSDHERLAELIDVSSRAQSRAVDLVSNSEEGPTLSEASRGADARPRGQTGAYESHTQHGRTQVRDRSQLPQLSAQRARERVQSVGIFAALGASEPQAGNSAPESPFGGLIASGPDSADAWGDSRLGAVADAFGYGGLGHVGVDSAHWGGGSGWGTTCGDGPSGCTAGSMGYGFGAGAMMHLRRDPSAVGHHLAERITHGPRVTGTSPTQCTLQNPDAIRRVIHRHMPEIQHCYEQALQRIPTLGGRITVRFVYGPEGAVLNARVQDDTVGDAQLSACVVSAFYRWQFVSSDSAVTVSYPILLRVD